MNRVYRLVRHRTTGKIRVVSELARGVGKSGRSRADNPASSHVSMRVTPSVFQGMLLLGALLLSVNALAATGTAGGDGGSPQNASILGAQGTGSNSPNNDGGYGGCATCGQTNGTAGAGGSGSGGGAGTTTPTAGGSGNTGGGSGGGGLYGGAGGGGGSLETQGVGGGGGVGGSWTAGGSATRTESYTGGSGGNGGSGGGGTLFVGHGYSGGGGGGGAAYYIGSGNLTLSGTYTGGAGGNAYFNPNDNSYGGGGGGGAGLVIGNTNTTVLAAGGAVNGGTGGGGNKAGNGGAGIVLGTGNTLTIDQNASVSGGAGGTGAFAGQGGVGIIATGSSLIDVKGSVSGGLSGSGSGASGDPADAIDLSGGGNTVQLDTTAQVTGKIVSSSGTTNGGDTLLLTGGGGTIGADQLVGFGTYAANGGAWTLTGTGDASQNWALSGGTTGLIGTTQSLVGNIDMGGGSYVSFLNNPSGTYGGVLSGAGDVSINGGSVAFAGQNTYSGATVLSNGATLSLTGNGVLGNNTYVSMGGGSVLDLSASNLAQNSDTQNLDDLAGDAGSVVHLGSGRINITGAGGQVFNGTIDGTGAALFTVSGGQWGLGGTVTTGLPFVIQGGAQVNIYGDGTITNGVIVNGMLSLGNANQGFTTQFLQGSGMVALSDKSLTLTDGGDSTYYGQVTGGAGSTLHLTGGTQIFTRDVGFQFFSGKTLIDPGANLLLNLAATMPKSNVTVNGTLTVAGPGPSTAEVRTLNGDGVVNITGSRALQIDDQGGVFSGTITNATNTTGNLVIASSAAQTLSGVNTYNGTTTLRGASTLTLSGAGSIADSANVIINILSLLDLSGTTAGTTIQQVQGSGNIQLGDQTLTLSNPNANNMTFDGQILGASGGLHLQNGKLTLSLPGTYHGDTVIDPTATLALSGQGSLANSTVVVNGTLDGTATNLVNPSNNNYVVVGGLSGDGVVNLAQPNSLQINNAQNSVFSGQLNFGSGTPGQLGFLVMQGGTQTFDSAISLPIAALIQQNATLKFGSNGSLSLPAQGGLYNDGTLDFSASSATQTTGTIGGLGAMILGSGGLSLTGDNSEYTGVISGSGGINLTTGTLVFDGANTYSGNTVVATGASLLLNNQGSLANSQVKNDGVVDLSAATINPTVAGISGSGALKLGSNTLHLASAQGVFDGALSGSGTLSMDGGSWIYNTTAAQASGFTGATNITGGQMMVGDEQHSSAFLPGDVAVQSGATLRGHGTIGGNVQNDGTVFPGGSVGILTVNGNYTQGANGVMTAQVLPSTNPVAGVDYDQLHVLGQATLDGALDVVVDSGQYTVGTQYDLIKADGGVSGQFAQVAYNPAFAAYITPTVQYSANTASLRLLPTAAPTPTQAPTPGLAYTTANAAVAQPWITQHSLLSVGDTLADAPTHGRVSGRHVWVRALKGQGGANAASVDQNGVVLGASKAVSDDWSAGVAFAHTRTQTQTSYQSVQGRGLGLYALSEFNQGPWRIDASVGGGRLTQDSTRHLDPTGLVASGDTHGWYGSAAVKAKYRHQINQKGFIEPYAGAAYLYSHIQAFEESGAGLLNLAYASRGSSLGRFSTGVKAGMDFGNAGGMQIRPWILAGVNAYAGDTQSTQNLSLGVLDQTLTARSASHTALATGAGVTFESPRHQWRTTFAYEGEHSHDSHFNSVQLKVSYRW
ncbi:MAG: hypothetical protein B7X28_01220 [Halothiobacillus sp. 13-55-253]|jgi:hypothetical protein|nr:MAG: hypothetical protein B7X28_01220 [Halothiobacillus sp. 13-55-253]